MSGPGFHHQFWLRARLIAFSVLVVGLVAQAQEPDRSAKTLSNERLIATVDGSDARIALTTKSGRPLLKAATFSVNIGDRTVVGSQFGSASSADVTPSKETELPGNVLSIPLEDRKRGLECTWQITLLKDRPGAVFELIVTNHSKTDVPIPSMEPLRALRDEESGCFFGVDGETSHVTKALTNGYIYYDPGKLLDFSTSRTTDFDSFWNAAFYSPSPRGSLVVGHLDNDRAEGHVLAGRPKSDQKSSAKGAFSLTVQSRFQEAFILRPGDSISSGRVLFLVSEDPHAALEFYAERAGRLHHARLNPVINGWCTWFVYYGGATEQNVIDHAKFVARELKGYGMDWIQVDDGYYRGFGDWEGNVRFPHGMKWVADQIRAQGLRPGLWIAPFAISENTDVVRNHPDWLIHNAKGEVQKIAPDHQAQAQYILDITHPGAQQWLEQLIHTIVDKWGYDFIKTDFVEWTLLAAERYHDPAVSKAQAYRLGNQIIRRAMGPERHLLDCGPGLEAVGLIDSMRIGLDRPDDTPGFHLFDQYAGFYNSAIGASCKRYFFHNRTWINDPDHLRLGKLSIPEAQCAATIIAMSGGTTISGDNLLSLDQERLAILRKILPACGQVARPIDLFDNPQAELFSLPVRNDDEGYLVVADYNLRSQPRSCRLELARLGLDASKTYLAYEFWTQKFLGEVVGRLNFESQPLTVNLFALREKSGSPQLLGTDRHYTQGGVELKDMHWDPAANRLSATAFGPPDGSWNIAVYVPNAFVAMENLSAVGGALSDIKCDGRVLRAKLRFDGLGKLNWSIPFKKS